MINGDYLLIVAPHDWKGKRYRNKYIYEHHYVYWKHTGTYIKENQIIHHINEDKHDNRFENLELQTRSCHASEHGKNKQKCVVDLRCPVCESEFTRDKRNTHLVKTRTTVTTCSRSCSAKLSTFVKQGGNLEDLKNENVIKIYYK